jgi:hypothetical protein
MTYKLVQTHAVPPVDERFFRALAHKTEPFWISAKSLGQAEAHFDAQEIPLEDRPTPNCKFRLLFKIPSVAAALESYVAARGFESNRNAVVYNPMSFMRWHTNSNSPGLRHYFTYTTGRAIFRWRHPKTGEIFDEIDGKGWTYRTFVISPTQPVWHTIWTEKVRLSFGFNSSYAAAQTSKTE